MTVKPTINSLISHYDNYSYSEKSKLINTTLSQLDNNKRAVFWGRILSLFLVIAIAPMWCKIACCGLYIVLFIRQRIVGRHFKEMLTKDTLPIEAIEKDILINGLTRNFALCVMMAGLVSVNSSLAQSTAALLVAGHLIAFLFRNSLLPRADIFGAAPSFITIFIVFSIKAIETQNVLFILAPIFFLVTVYNVALKMMSDTLNAFDLNNKLSETANQLEQSAKSHKRELLLREELELLAGVGTYNWVFENNAYSWSPGAYKLFGHDENLPPLVADEFLERLSDKTREEFVNVTVNSSQNSTPFTCHYEFKTADGTIKQIMARGSPYFDENGAAIGMTGMMIDETEAYLALQSLAEQQELLQAALVNSGTIVFVHDIASGKTKAYGDLSTRGLTQYNQDNIELDIKERIGYEDRKQLFKNWSKAAISNKSETGEYTIKTADGEIRNIRYTVRSNAKGNNKPTKLISVNNDVTADLKKSIELSTALKEANRANRAKTEFLANMSHEIRTPLNGVIAVVGLLARTKLSKDQSEMVELIETSGDSLRDILNDVLDIARIESEKLEIEKSAFNLDGVLNNLVSLFRARANEKGLELCIELPKSNERAFIGDANRIRQILSNLLSNAIKFTQSGKVILRAQVVKGSAENNLRTIKFEVEDTGRGISRADLSRLFARFEQIDGTITREHGGSGLGLSISKSLAELMDGKISAISKLGKGSRFKFELPLETCANKEINYSKSVKNEKQTSNKATEPMTNSPQKIKILAADDNPTNLKILEMILSPLGIELTLCENGLEAAECFAQVKFDIVLMDLQMPVLDGLSAMRIMRVQEAIKMMPRTPIIAVSASAMTHNIKEATENGADFLIAKPFTPASLIEGVERALSLLESKDESPQATIAA